jgi:HK97 family phage major capsid protein
MLVNFDGQIIAADTVTRTITGLVVPFSKVGNTSAGPVQFEFGAFGEIDASKIVLNTEHDRTRPLGRGIAGSESVSPLGVSMAFKIAPTNAGNDALVEASEGLRPSFSVEAQVNEYTIDKGVMHVSSARLEAVAHVTNPAFKDAAITQVAATEETPETTEAETAATEQPQEIIVDEITAPVAEEIVASAVIHAAAPVAYAQPRSPIRSKATYLEHSIKASLGNHDSAQFVMHADAEASKLVTAADDSFTTNPAFSPVSYVSTVVDTLIGARPAIDAIGSRAISASGMTISHPKITTNSTVAVTAEGAGPSETGITSAYVNLDVKKYAGLQRYSVELIERSDPGFFQAMVDNMQRAYNKATDAAVIAELTAGGTQGATVAATSAGIISYVSVEAPAAYLATGDLASAYIAGTSQWSLLLGATDTTGRPIYNAANPQNNAGQAAPRSLRGDVLGLDLYVDPNAVSTTIDESAFIVVPSAVAIYESPLLRMSTNVVTSGEIETMLYGYMAVGVLVAGGVRRFNLT